jgi:hypothetical protein
MRKHKTRYERAIQETAPAKNALSYPTSPRDKPELDGRYNMSPTLMSRQSDHIKDGYYKPGRWIPQNYDSVELPG